MYVVPQFTVSLNLSCEVAARFLFKEVICILRKK